MAGTSGMSGNNGLDNKPYHSSGCVGAGSGLDGAAHYLPVNDRNDKNNKALFTSTWGERMVSMFVGYLIQLACILDPEDVSFVAKPQDPSLFQFPILEISVDFKGWTYYYSGVTLIASRGSPGKPKPAPAMTIGGAATTSAQDDFKSEEKAEVLETPSGGGGGGAAGSGAAGGGAGGVDLNSIFMDSCGLQEKNLQYR